MPVSPTGSFRVTVSDFLADGGDDFTVFKDGSARVAGPPDIEAWCRT
ncbi:MAG: hypothetical protein ACRD12_04055 [Acidimicrobiales bacterium]